MKVLNPNLVIPTGAKRSGGPAFREPFLEMFFDSALPVGMTSLETQDVAFKSSLACDNLFECSVSQRQPIAVRRRIRRRIKGAHLNRIGLHHGQRRCHLVQTIVSVRSSPLASSRV
jgi:hypothetical protein